jgi:hypothetical protein
MGDGPQKFPGRYLSTLVISTIVIQEETIWLPDRLFGICKSAVISFRSGRATSNEISFRPEKVKFLILNL